MNAIIIYYSVSGQTEYVAKELKEKLHCDSFQIETASPIKPNLISRYYAGTKSMMSSSLPELKPYELDLSKYDTVILGFPNWGSHCPAAMKAFLLKENITGKRLYLYTTYVARGGNACLKNMANFMGANEIVNSMKFSLPKSKKKEELKHLFSEFV